MKTRYSDLPVTELKEYHRIRSREWYQRHRANPVSIAARRTYRLTKFRQRKASLVAELGGKCIRCGFSEHPAALDFHHRDPSQKKFTLGPVLAQHPWEVLLVEAQKCDLLCSNCHRIHHWQESE